MLYLYMYDILMYTTLECVFLSFEPYPNVLDSVAETGGCFKGGDWVHWDGAYFAYQVG